MDLKVGLVDGLDMDADGEGPVVGEALLGGDGVVVIGEVLVLVLGALITKVTSAASARPPVPLLLKRL